MTIRGIIQVLGGIGALAGLWWAVDVIGDRREIKVHARYAAAAEATNVDLAAFNTEDERVAAIADKLREKAVAEAQAVPGPTCAATPEQADALNRIIK